MKGAEGGSIGERLSARQQAKILEGEAQEYERLGRGGADVGPFSKSVESNQEELSDEEIRENSELIPQIDRDE